MIVTGILIWFFATLILMALFSGTEMGYYTVSRLNMELKKKQGKRSAIVLSKFVENPEAFVGTMITGFTLSLVGFVMLFRVVTSPLWQQINFQNHTAILIIDIILAAFVVLILAEFIPKAIFRRYSNIMLSPMIFLINIFFIVLRPVTSVFVVISNWITRFLFNVRMSKDRDAFERADIETLFRQSDEAVPERQELNTEMFENVLELSKVKIRECLVPRKEIIGIEKSASVDEARKVFIETHLSKLVVFEKTIDNIIGYIHQLDLFKQPAALQDILLPIPAVPETMSATDLIKKFTNERKSIAWVVDEFGGTAGIVTMEDVLEEIFGEIHDEYDVEEFIEKQISEDEFIFSGRLELDYLTDKFELEFPDDSESETLSGYIINHHETIPQQKERIIIGNYEFDILSVSHTRIETVKLKVLK